MAEKKEWLQQLALLRKEESAAQRDATSHLNVAARNNAALAAVLRHDNDVFNDSRKRFSRLLFQKVDRVHADCTLLKTYLHDINTGAGYVPRLKRTIARITDATDAIRNDARSDYEILEKEENDLAFAIDDLLERAEKYWIPDTLRFHEKYTKESSNPVRSAVTQKSAVQMRPPPPGRGETTKTTGPQKSSIKQKKGMNQAENASKGARTRTKSTLKVPGKSDSSDVRDVQEEKFHRAIQTLDSKLRQYSSTGGWREEEHAVFHALLQRIAPTYQTQFLTYEQLYSATESNELYDASKSVSDIQPLTQHEKTRLIQSLSTRIVDKTDADFDEHCDWYHTINMLKLKKRIILAQWKKWTQEKRAKQAELEANQSVVDPDAEKRRKAEEIRQLRRRTAAQKAAVAKWKANKAADQEQNTAKSAAKAAQEARDRETRELRDRAAAKARLFEYQLQKRQEEANRRAREKIIADTSGNTSVTPEDLQKFKAKREQEIRQAVEKGTAKRLALVRKHQHEQQILNPRRGATGIILTAFDPDHDVEEEDINHDHSRRSSDASLLTHETPISRVKGAGIFSVRQVRSDPARVKKDTQLWRIRRQEAQKDAETWAKERGHQGAHEAPILLAGRAADSRGKDFTFGGHGVGRAQVSWRAN